MLPDYQWSGHLRRQMDAVDYPRPDAGQTALSGFDILAGKYRLKHTGRSTKEIAACRFNQQASLPAEPFTPRVRLDREGKGLEAGAGSNYWMGQEALSRYHCVCTLCLVKHRQKIVKEPRNKSSAERVADKIGMITRRRTQVIAGSTMPRSVTQWRPRAWHEGPAEAGIGQRRGCSDRGY